MSDQPRKPSLPQVDLWDVLCGTGLVMLLAGLWAWLGMPIALTVTGSVLLCLGVTGTWAASRPERPEVR